MQWNKLTFACVLKEVVCPEAIYEAYMPNFYLTKQQQKNSLNNDYLNVITISPKHMH